MNNYLFSIAAILFSITAFTQSSTKWKAGFEAQKVFIENKSQFDGKNDLGDSEILFGTDESPVMIYFTKKGLTYSFTKTEIEQKSAEEHLKEETQKRRKEEEHEVEITTDIVNMEWENSNPSVQVVPLEEQSFYFSYSMDEKNLNHVKSFKKILYKELYPNIDAEYIFHPQEGIKYSLILHPGADISQVKMKYSGTNRIFLDTEGRVHLATKFGDIIDHAPITTYEYADNSSIPSHFIKTGKTISFELGNYDRTQTVIVDPWTITPSMPSANIVYYIKSDSVGNAYLFGGDNPIRLQKYDPSGALVWTYNTPWTTGSIWFGASVTDRSGNSYITDGTGATCRKIDPSGAFVWSNSSAQPPANSIEYWALALNCDETQLMVAGSRHVPFSFSFNATVFKINMSSGAVSSFVNVAHKAFTGTPAGIAEVRSMCSSPNGNYYYLTMDTVGAVSNNLSLLLGQSTNYNFPYYMLYSSPSGSGQGQNNICANSQFIYTTDGGTLHKRDINTGAILATAVIPSGAANNNSGVAVDSCGNVYAGAQNRVVKYDGNLTLINSVATPEPVYDLSIGANGDVLACGHNFAVALAMSACKPLKAICSVPLSANISQTNVGCNTGCNGTATANTVGGTGTLTYLWSVGGQTTQTVTGLCAGSYMVTITDAASVTASASVTIIQTGILTLSSSVVNTSCGNSNGSATITAATGNAPFTYLWSNGGTTQSITNVAAGTYLVTVTDAGGCSSTASAIVNPSGNNPVTITQDKTIMCSGDSAQVCAPSGYASYLWNTGQTGMCIYTKLAGNYYVTITDNGSCTATSNHLAVAVYPLPPVSISVNGDTLTAYNANTYQWYLNGNSIPNATSNVYIATQTGDYTVAVTDSNGCLATSTKVTIVTGIRNLIHEEEVKVYPNPLSVGNWSLDVGNKLIGSIVEVFDGDGRLVFKSEIRSQKSEIEINIARGIYTMRISSEQKNITLKLIKL